MTEYVASLNESDRSREEILEDVRERLEEVPGIVFSVEQPLAHLISHMISGVKAQVGIKLYGDDLATLRQNAKLIEAAMNERRWRRKRASRTANGNPANADSGRRRPTASNTA